MRATISSLLLTGMICAASLVMAMAVTDWYQRDGWSLVLDDCRDVYVLDYGMSMGDCYDAMMRTKGAACERN